MDNAELTADARCIGAFGDQRLCKTGMLLFSRILERDTVHLRRLSDDRATQKRYHRFLESPKVTPKEIERCGSDRTALAAVGRHVLVFQDTSELNFSAHRGRTTGLGSISSRNGYGLLIHPALAVDAQSNACLGIVHQAVWIREESETPKRERRPIEEKESMRWIEGAHAARRRLKQASLVTVIADRESDIYEEWDRVPDGHTHLLTRARHDRQLEDGTLLSEWLDRQPVMDHQALDVPARAAGKAYRSTDGARSSARTAHWADMELRFGQVRIKRPVGSRAKQASIALTVIELRECADTVPPGEQPVRWILLTTHAVRTKEEALVIVGWYRQRWQIEQLFRTLKRQGLGIESSQLEHGDELLKLACIATLAAVRTLQLVNARNGQTQQPASDAFDDDEMVVLEKLQDKFQGKTAKQKNPHALHSMAWAAWTIARLGGWTGYASEAKPGPITMLHGLQRFDGMVQGWKLAQMWA